MSFGSFIKGIAAQVNPFDRGKTYSTYNPAKKRLPDDQNTNNQPAGISVSVAHPNQNISVDQPVTKPPVNVFDANKNLVLGQKPPSVVPVFANPNTQPAPTPQPGVVVQPNNQQQRISGVTTAPAQSINVAGTTVNRLPGARTNSLPEAPKPVDNSILGKFKRGLGMAKDTAVGSVENLPEVGLAATRAGSGLVQGALNLPHDITALNAGFAEQSQKHFDNPYTRVMNRIAQATNTGVKTATHYAVNDTLDPLNRNLDNAAKIYERKVPGAASGAQIYKTEQIPLNALALLLTAGASGGAAAGEAGDVGEAANLSRIGRAKAAIGDFFTKPRMSNEDNIIAKAGQSITAKGRPVAEALNAPVKAAGGFINKFRNAERGVVDTGEIGNLLTDAQAGDLATTQIPVGTGIDVNAPPSEPVNIPVTNGNKPAPIIQELGGDAKTATTNAQAAQNAVNVRRVEAAKKADTGLPDTSLDGVTPRTPSKPFALNEADVAANKEKVVSDYADLLKNVGEGNGVTITEDGRRLSNNVRSAENKGKRMTKADWQDEARSQLEAGKGHPGAQQAFNDAGNPDVQSLINGGEQAPQGQGRPITVKSARGIDVVDQTNVPQNLPEKPGTVRVTNSTEPVKAKSEAVAAETPSISTSELSKSAKNSLENDTTGQKPNGVERSGGRVENGTSKPVEYKYNEDGSVSIVDGRHTLEYARKNGIEDYPTKDVTNQYKGTSGNAPAVKTPDNLPQADESLASAHERLVKSLKENQNAQRVEKKINSAEKSRRFAEKQRIYNELVGNGMSRKEAEQQATAALKGKYTDNTVANFDVNSKQAEEFRKAIDNVADDPMNTKRAFEHMIDPNQTDPLQPWERTRIRAFVQKSLGEDAAQAVEEAISTAEKAGDRGLMGDISGFVTSTIASGDISAVGRQGIQGLVNHPVMSKEAFTESMKALTSADHYKKFVSDLASKPNTAFVQQNFGGHFLSLSDIADEARGKSDAAEKFVGTRWFVNPSNRQYNTYLDSLRSQQFDSIIEKYGGQDGILKAAEASGNSEKWMKAWGKVVNAGTGRGSFGATGSPAVGDVQVLFSARNLASKFQRLTSPLDIGLLRSNPAAYRYQVKEVGTLAAALTASLGAAHAAGLDIENGKIKVGNTRYDISGGFMTILNSMNNIRKAAGIGQDTSKNAGLSRTPLDITKDFLQNQLSPLVGDIAKLMDVKPPGGGKGWHDKYGNPIDATWLTSNVAPIPGVAQAGIQSLLQGESPGQIAGNMAAEGLGINTTTYQSAADKKAAGASPGSVGAAGKDGGGTEDFAGFKDSAPKEGYSLTQLSDGSYAYSINGETHQTHDLKSAQEAVAKAGFTESGDNSKVVKDKFYYKDENGDTKSMPKYKHEFDVADSQNQLDMYTAKDNEDLGAWNESAGKQLKALETLRDKYNQDSQADKVDDVQKKIETLKHDIAKYKGYGGFTKGKSDTKALDTSFGTLKAGTGAPTVQQYDTISSKAGGVPHIKVVRPNIVHKISSSG